MSDKSDGGIRNILNDKKRRVQIIAGVGILVCIATLITLQCFSGVLGDFWTPVVSSIFATALTAFIALLVIEVNKFNNFIGDSISESVIRVLTRKNDKELEGIDDDVLHFFENSSFRVRLNIDGGDMSKDLVEAVSNRSGREFDGPFIIEATNTRDLSISENHSDKNVHYFQRTTEIKYRNFKKEKINFDIEDVYAGLKWSPRVDGDFSESHDLTILQLEIVNPINGRDVLYSIENEVPIPCDTGGKNRVWDITLDKILEKNPGKIPSTIPMNPGEIIEIVVVEAFLISKGESMSTSWNRFRRNQEFVVNLVGIEGIVKPYSLKCDFCRQVCIKESCDLSQSSKNEDCIFDYKPVGGKGILKLDGWAPPSTGIEFRWVEGDEV